MRTSTRIGPTLLVIAAYTAITVGTVTVTAELAETHPDAVRNLQAMLAQMISFSIPHPSATPEQPIQDTPPLEDAPSWLFDEPPVN